jgi:glycerol-3-phosphate dehydrogenase
MNRSAMLARLSPELTWDIIIIGGGATGLGAAVDAASRGYRTLLLEQYDFAKGTSGRSTKLVHGGVRYLQQGNIKLVMEALRERGLLMRNAPHLVHNQSFIVPNYKWWEGPFYGIGLKLYDWMSGKLGLGPSEWLNKEETLQHIPTLDPEGLRGGVIYHDGQFDDARLAINLAQTAAALGACVINYCPVKGFLKKDNIIAGVHARDEISGEEYSIYGKVVINATGIFTDEVLQMDQPNAAKVITPSQGIHIVLDKSFLPGTTAIMVPHTDDGRVLFAVPWHDTVIVGTTDTPVAHPMAEPRALEEEIDFVLRNIARYLVKDPSRQDVKSIFAGMRPLVKAGSIKSTAALSREHHIWVSDSGLLTITGGKWTTYRRMAEDVINKAAILAGLEVHPCITENLPVYGSTPDTDTSDPLHYYGTDATAIRAIIASNPLMGERIHPNLPYPKATILWGIRAEMAMTVEDILSRRTRALLLDASASIDAVKTVAEIMAAELGQGAAWTLAQESEFCALAEGYLLK